MACSIGERTSRRVKARPSSSQRLTSPTSTSKSSAPPPSSSGSTPAAAAAPPAGEGKRAPLVEPTLALAALDFKALRPPSLELRVHTCGGSGSARRRRRDAAELVVVDQLVLRRVLGADRAGRGP